MKHLLGNYVALGVALARAQKKIVNYFHDS